ncbi:MAG: PBSX family phage terminase large subunit [Candidatus Heimdallarchaeaceae archaeon]
MPIQTIDLPIVGKVYEQLLKSDKRHRIIVGGRGKGASWSIARILLAQGMAESKFIVCVREVQKSIEHSVKKLLDDTIKNKELQGFYRIRKFEIEGQNGTKFIFHGLQDYNADTIQSLEGADIAWVAEAQSISRRSINIFRPTIRKNNSVIWWDFNPRYETDAVYIDYILNKDPNAEVLWLNWKDNPWFTKSLIMEKDSDYRRNEEEARHIWEGELRAAGDLFVCPSELVDIAIANTILDPKGDIAVGADIAHQGGDEIVFYKRHGLKIIDKYFSRYQDQPTTVRHLKAFTGYKDILINIDNGDLGKGIADYLEQDGWLVNRINFGGNPVDTEHYQDAVTEMYFQFRDLSEQADIPNDEELRNQLIQRKYEYLSGRRGYEVTKIESKDKFKEHSTAIHKSPDRADALVLTYYNIRLGTDKIETLTHNIFS